MDLPFVTNPAWQAFAAALSSSTQGQHDLRVRVPVSAAFGANAEVLRGTQQLAVLAADPTRTRGRPFDYTSPARGRFADFRPFQRVESVRGEEDRRRIAVELEGAGLTGCAPAPPATAKRQRKLKPPLLEGRLWVWARGQPGGWLLGCDLPGLG